LRYAPQEIGLVPQKKPTFSDPFANTVGTTANTTNDAVSSNSIPTVNGVPMIDTGSVYQDNSNFFDNLNKGIVEGGTLTDNYKYKVPFEGARTIVPNPDYKDVMQGSVLDAQPKKGIMQTVSDAFFSPAAAAEIDFSQLQQANNKFTPEFSSMEMNNPGVKNYSGTTQQDFINAIQGGNFGVSGKSAFDRNKNELFSGVDLNKNFSPFNVEPTLIGTNDKTFRQSIDIDRDALETNALNALPENFFPGYRNGGLASMFTRRR